MKILIATDGSVYSDAAVAQCCNFLIDPDNAEILVVSAYEGSYPIAAEPFAISAEYYQQVEEAVRAQAASFVEIAEQTIRGRFPGSKISIKTEIMNGPPDQQIIIKATEWKADLIVVGSHGRGFWGRMLGSVSDGVVHHAPCSVLVVRKAEQ